MLVQKVFVYRKLCPRNDYLKMNIMKNNPEISIQKNVCPKMLQKNISKKIGSKNIDKKSFWFKYNFVTENVGPIKGVV